MLAPLVTLAFLTTLWMVARIALELADGTGSRIIAALKGRSVIARPPQSARLVTVRVQQRPEPVRRRVSARPEWRAAA